MAEAESAGNQPESVLGLKITELAGLSVHELENNPTAILMMMHYYRQLVGENLALRNEINTLNTYVDAYKRKRTNSAIGAVLLALSNVSVGFGVNLLSNPSSVSIWPGLSILIPGLAMIAVGLWFSYREGN